MLLLQHGQSFARADRVFRFEPVFLVWVLGAALRGYNRRTKGHESA